MPQVKETLTKDYPTYTYFALIIKPWFSIFLCVLQPRVFKIFNSIRIYLTTGTISQLQNKTYNQLESHREGGILKRLQQKISQILNERKQSQLDQVKTGTRSPCHHFSWVSTCVLHYQLLSVDYLPLLTHGFSFPLAGTWCKLCKFMGQFRTWSQLKMILHPKDSSSSN